MNRPDPFAAAKAISVAALVESAGVTLRRAGGRLVGACPLCGGEKDSTRFSVSVRPNLWHCFGCGQGGAAIELEQALRGGSALDAARRLAGDGGLGVLPRAPANRPAPAPSFTAPIAARLWREAGQGCDCAPLARAWFVSRGLDVAALGFSIARLKFHPDALAASGGFGRTRWEARAPAILAPIVDANQKLIGVHATYLSRDGASKAALQTPDGEPIPSRKIWGRAKGGVCPLTPLRETALGPLHVGEGLETTLSALQLEGGRAAAVLSLDNLQGGWLKDEEGCSPCWPPKPDPARPPWTLANAGLVRIIVDADMSPIRIKLRDETGAPRQRTLDASARAQLCADLACAAWRAAGAETVFAFAPARAGADLNDMVREG